MLSSMRLSPSTLMGKEENKKIKTIIQSIIDKPESYDFQAPVDWKGMGLTDYTFIIKNPMDLGTISQKLQNDKYRYVEEALDDIQLIWDNCKTYNHPETWIYKTAQNLERLYKKMVKNYLPNIPIIVPGRQTGSGRYEEKRQVHNNLFEQDENEDQVPYHQKMKFYQKMKHLTPEGLGQIAEFISARCPDAWEEEGDNARLLLDNLDQATFDAAQDLLIKLNDDYEQKTAKKIKQ